MIDSIKFTLLLLLGLSPKVKIKLKIFFKTKKPSFGLKTFYFLKS